MMARPGATTAKTAASGEIDDQLFIRRTLYGFGLGQGILGPFVFHQSGEPVCKKSFTYSFRYSINFLFSKRFSLKNKAFGAIAALLMPDPAISLIQSAQCLRVSRPACR
jgi:hypothetical protein